MRIALGFVLILATVGLIEGAVLLGGHVLGGGDLPSWPIWQYGASALVVGALYLLAEAAFHPITSFLVDSDRVDDPLWKRSLRVIGIVIFVCTVAAVAGLVARWWGRAA